MTMSGVACGAAMSGAAMIPASFIPQRLLSAPKRPPAGGLRVGLLRDDGRPEEFIPCLFSHRIRVRWIVDIHGGRGRRCIRGRPRRRRRPARRIHAPAPLPVDQHVSRFWVPVQTIRDFQNLIVGKSGIGGGSGIGIRGSGRRGRRRRVFAPLPFPVHQHVSRFWVPVQTIRDFQNLFVGGSGTRTGSGTGARSGTRRRRRRSVLLLHDTPRVKVVVKTGRRVVVVGGCGAGRERGSKSFPQSHDSFLFPTINALVWTRGRVAAWKDQTTHDNPNHN